MAGNESLENPASLAWTSFDERQRPLNLLSDSQAERDTFLVGFSPRRKMLSEVPPSAPLFAGGALPRPAEAGLQRGYGCDRYPQRASATTLPEGVVVYRKLR